MNEHVPPFLQALELGPDADERAIRRAYAKRLKLIDAETDPAGFQALRETLESALQWAAWRAREAAEEATSRGLQEQGQAAGSEQLDPRPADPPPHGAATPIATAAPLVRGAEPGSTAGTTEPDPEAAPALPPGEPAFLDFHAHFQRGVESPEHATALLEAALADERLVNLEARTFFEWRVAGLLANGWQPGHELLFWPAAVVFGWDKDRRHLELFGRLGAFMDTAIRERLVFFGQEPSEFDRQRQLIQRLRVARAPDRKELVDAMPRLALLLQRFPNWTRTMTPEANVQQWIAAWNVTPPAERERQQKAAAAAAEKAARRRQSASSGGFRWGWILVAIGVVRGIAALGGGDSHAPPPPYESRQLSLDPEPPKLDPKFDNTTPQYTVPTAPVTPPDAHRHAAAQPGTRRAADTRPHPDFQPLQPTIPTPWPRAQPTSESPAPGASKYELHAKPEEARIDPTAVQPLPRRRDAGYTPPADLRLTSPADGQRLRGLADLERPAPAAPAKPDEPAQ